MSEITIAVEPPPSITIEVNASGPPGLAGTDGLGPEDILAGTNVTVTRTATTATISATSFDGQYSSLTGTPTLGTAAAQNVGTGADTVAAGDDPRLSDSRTPTSHAGSHAAAGSDPVVISQEQVTGLGAALSALSSAISGVSTPPLGVLRVATSDAPSDVKAGADFTLTGTNDQTIINQALLKASRPGDGFGGQGLSGVQLVGPNVLMGHNGATAITMYPATKLFAAGPGVLIQPRWPSNVDRGAVELLNSNTAHCTIDGLTFGRPDSIRSNGHHIKLTGVGSATQYEIETGSDYFIEVLNCRFLKPARSGLYFTGTSGGVREMVVRDCVSWDAGAEAFYIDSSDSEIIGCRAANSAGTAAFMVQGGNTKITDCKSYYSDSPVHGFYIGSSRCEISDCAAQDNGYWGFYFVGDYVTASTLVADSNDRLATTAGDHGGFYIASSGIYQGLHAFDRNQTPAKRQLRGIVFSGTPNAYVTGRAAAQVTVGAPVSGSLSANSYARILTGSLDYTSGIAYTPTTMFTVG